VGSLSCFRQPSNDLISFILKDNSLHSCHSARELGCYVLIMAHLTKDHNNPVRWVVFYPIYIEAKATQAEGRRIPKDKVSLMAYLIAVWRRLCLEFC
jgi:hypothetical protein